LKEFKKYVNRILKSLDCNTTEKEELYYEFMDHLDSLKNEYLIKGYSEKEAIKYSIRDFGKENMVSTELNKSISRTQKVINKATNISWWLYIAILAKLLLWPGRTPGLSQRRISLEPFKQIMTYIVRYEHYNFDIWFNNLFGNVIIFIPFGLLLPICLRKGNSLISNLYWTLMVSFFIEAAQYYFYVGIFDVDDIILNVIGGFIGFIVYKALLVVLKKHEKEYLI